MNDDANKKKVKKERQGEDNFSITASMSMKENRRRCAQLQHWSRVYKDNNLSINRKEIDNGPGEFST